jgi:hypothetical protein
MSLKKKDLLNYMMVSFNNQTSSINPTKVLNTQLCNLNLSSITTNIGTLVTISNASGIYSFNPVPLGYIYPSLFLPTNNNSSTFPVFIDLSDLVTKIQKIYSVIYGTSPTLIGFTSLTVKSITVSPLSSDTITKNYLITGLANYQTFVNGLTGSTLTFTNINTTNNVLYSYLSTIIKFYNNKIFNKFIGQSLELNDDSINIENLMLSVDQNNQYVY